MSRRWRYPRSRRGDFYTIIPMTVVAPPPFAQVFQEPSGRNSRPRTTRRGRFYAIVPVASYVPLVTEPAGRNSRPRVVRRGRFYPVPSVGVTAGPGPWPPTFQRPTTRRLAAPRRGEFLAVPKTGLAPAVQTPPPPTFTRARRVPAVPTRRGDYQVVPLLRATCPVRIVSRRPAVSVRRRGQVWAPSWVYVPPAPPTFGVATAATGPAPSAHGATASVPCASSATAGSATARSASGTVPTATGG